MLTPLRPGIVVCSTVRWRRPGVKFGTSSVLSSAALRVTVMITWRYLRLLVSAERGDRGPVRRPRRRDPRATTRLTQPGANSSAPACAHDDSALAYAT